MSLSIEHRVYAEGSTVAAPCMWFALCDNDANGLRRGPVGGGKFGEIPICKRCDDKVEALGG
jgi:hypothetical protein